MGRGGCRSQSSGIDVKGAGPRTALGMAALGMIAPIAATALVACAPGHTLPRAHAPSLGDDELRCRDAALQDAPLLTEWSAAEKANLEAQLASGAVAVEFSGCSMRLVRGCHVRGSYRWQRTTLSSDTLNIDNEDELFAKLPLGAVSLEGELSRAGQLNVETTVGGQYLLDGFDIAEVPDHGACSEATHVLTSLSVGAFRLNAGGRLQATAGVETGEAGVGSSTRSSEKQLRSAGDPESCRGSTDESPHVDCRSPIQAFLTPLPRYERAKGHGSVKANFYAGNAGERWELRSDKNFVCATPCSTWVTPGQAYELRHEAGPVLEDVPVPALDPYVGASQLDVYAFEKQTGRMITGITLTGVAGGLMFIGGFMALAGGLAERDGLVTGGAITAGIGAVTIIPGIYLIATSGSEVLIQSDRDAASYPRELGAARGSALPSGSNETAQSPGSGPGKGVALRASF
ncbi:MAG TPA: hypothetical protein VLC09_11940 [Polyangiaceae bacterium]|nr:hypothetical protein [Polyangiaceae bacterium]